MRGEATQAQMAGFLVALRAKGETAEEIAGCAEAMREHVVRVHPSRDDVVDVVGTGGDGARTFNISTTAAFVAAAAGAPSPSTATAPSAPRPARPTSSRRWASSSSTASSASPSRSTISASASCSRPHTTRQCATPRPSAGARHANGLQRARPADEPRRRTRRHLRRLRARGSCARSPTPSPRSTRGAHSSCTARTASTSSRRAAPISSARSAPARCTNG